MADLEVQGLTQAINSHAASTLDSIEGLHESISNVGVSLSQINDSVGESGWFHDVLSQITLNQDTYMTQEDARWQLDSSSESLSAILDMMATKNTKEAEKEGIKTKTSGLKIDDLKTLNSEQGIGFALLSSQVADIADILKEKKAGGDGGGGDGQATSFFKNLLKGAAGIAALGAALAIFAGATMLFNFVDWPKALKGLLAFSLFTIGNIVVANLVGDNVETFSKFAMGALLMSGALAVFSIAVSLTSAIFDGAEWSGAIGTNQFHLPRINIVSALKGTGLFLTFTLGLVVVANLVKEKTGDFSKFAAGSFIMSAALAVFSVAIAISSAIMDGRGLSMLGIKLSPVKVLPALKGIGLFLTFTLGLVLISRLVKDNIPDFVKFGLGSMVMSGAMVVFGIAIGVTAGILTPGEHNIMGIKFQGASIGSAIAGLVSFMAFLLGTVLLAKLAQNFIADIALLAGVSMLMSLAMAAFGFAITSVILAVQGGSATFGGVEFNFGKEDNKRLLWALAGLLTMVTFLAAFAALGIAAVYVGGPIALASGVLIMASLAMIAGAQAVSLAAFIGNPEGGEIEYAGKKYMLPAHTVTDVVAGVTMVNSFLNAAAKINILSLTLLMNIAPMLKAIVPAIRDMVEVTAEALSIKSKLEAQGIAWDPSMLEHVMDVPIAVIKEVGKAAENLKEGSGRVIKALAGTISPIIKGIDQMVDVTVKAMKISKELGADLQPEQLEGIMDPVMAVISAIGTQAEKIGRRGAGVIKTISSCLQPVTESIAIMVDVVGKAAALKGPNGEDVNTLSIQANNNIKLLMIGQNGDAGFIGAFNAIVTQVEGVSAKKRKTIGELQETVDVVKTVMDSLAEIGAAALTTKITNANKTFVATKETMVSFQSNIVPFTYDGGIYKSYKKTFNNMKDMVQAFSDFTNSLTNIDTQKVINFVSFGESLGSFNESMKMFKEGMNDNLFKVVTKWKDPKHISVFNSIADSLEKMSATSDINIQPIMQLAEAATQLNSVAISLSAIQGAMDSLAKSKGLDNLNKTFMNVSEGSKHFKSLLDKQDSIAKNKVESQKTTMIVSADDATKKMWNDVMSKWTEGVVPVKLVGEKDSSKEEEEAKPKLGWGRK